jgi:hypothetical protein
LPRSFRAPLNKQQSKRRQQQFFQQFKSKPFWIWNKEKHKRQHAIFSGKCCFNHIIGLPQKNGVQMPLFDYQRRLIDTLLHETKYLWLKKSTGIGATELFLRWMAWLCVRDDAMKGKEMAIITGPNLNLSIGLIQRLKSLFLDHGIVFDTKQNSVTINGCEINAYPSNHLDAMRSRTDLKVIFADEADYFEKGESAILRDVCERYIGKSDPWIILVSTPNRPDGLFASIESEERSLYRKIVMDYTVGLNRIYTPKEIEQARKSPSFPREYECRFLGNIGNVFRSSDIDYAVNKLGKRYDPNVIDRSTPKALGIDPAWGSSAFGVCVIELHGGINVLLAQEYGNRPSYEYMLQHVLDIMHKYGNVHRIYIDSSASAFVTSLKQHVGERTDWPEHLQQIKLKNWDLEKIMTVIPVNFNRELAKHDC